MRSHRGRPQGDTGGAMLIVVLVGADPDRHGPGAGQDRRSPTSTTPVVTASSAGALGIAEAGVAEAITHLRGNGVHHICAPARAPWNVSAPTTLDLPERHGGRDDRRASQRYRPPATRVGRYLVRSVGTTAAADPGKRTVEQEVDVKPFAFPLGVYTAAKVNLGGNVEIQQESFFSGQCIDSRSKMTFVAGPDRQLHRPLQRHPGRRPLRVVHHRPQHQRLQHRPRDGAGDGHAAPSTGRTPATRPTGPTRARSAGPSPPGTCPARTAGKGDYADRGSAFSMDVLRDSVRLRAARAHRRPVRPAEGQGEGGGDVVPRRHAPCRSRRRRRSRAAPATTRSSTSRTRTSTSAPSSTATRWVARPERASTLHPSVLLVIERGSLKLGSSTRYTGNIFVPDGDVVFSGGAELTGTVFAKNLKFIGGGRIGLNDCAPPTPTATCSASPRSSFREIDH